MRSIQEKANEAIKKNNRDGSKWYAIYTRSRFEKKTNQALQQIGFETFLPMIKEKRAWSDRIKSVEVPLLPSYVFIKTSNFRDPRILRAPGFVHLVIFEGRPSEIKEKEIRLLEKIKTHGFHVESGVRCCVGDLVRIVRGPLKGWEGRVDSERGHSRIVFQVEGLHQAISVEVGLGDVENIR